MIASVPKRLWFLPFQELRKEAYIQVKESGFIGGSCVWHPFRETEDGRWYFSPHFHMFGYGWIQGTKKIYENSGWVIKNEGIRKTLHGTAMYQLSHAGIHKKFHTVTWFGRLSYNNLRCKKMPKKEDKCPLCGADLVKLIWMGEGLCSVPDELGEYKVSSEGWTEVYRILKPGDYYYSTQRLAS